jgi:hypothetical protein
MASARKLAVGCTYNVVQLDVDVTPLQRFEIVRDAGVFDYINWLPRSAQLAACVAAAERTGIPMTTGNVILTLGRDDALQVESMHNAARAGTELVNVMLQTRHADGHELTDDEIVRCFLTMAEAGAAGGVTVAFEIHVDCWTEKYKRVVPVIAAVRARGVPFHLTVDYRHCIFKMGNDEELTKSGVRTEELDPVRADSFLAQWLALDVVDFAQFRPVAPNNPRNVWGRNPDGSLPRGIFYPFVEPGPGEWHTPWSAQQLDTCKEAFRTILRYHRDHASSPLRYAITEIIPQPDYAMGAKFSIIDQNAACARWIRNEWSALSG